MESPPCALYRAPPSIGPRPKVPSAESQLGSTNDSDDIYEQLPSDDSEVGSGDALVRPSLIRQRQAAQQKHGKMEPSASDNFVTRNREFENVWVGARRSHRELGSNPSNVGTVSAGGGNAKSHQAYLAFATGRRSHHSRSINNNGTSTQFRHPNASHHGPGNNVPGRINIAEYSAVTDALARMRLPRTSPPYTNLPNDDYVSDTGHRNRPNRSRRNPG